MGDTRSQPFISVPPKFYVEVFRSHQLVHTQIYYSSSCMSTLSVCEEIRLVSSSGSINFVLAPPQKVGSLKASGDPNYSLLLKLF